MLLNGSLKTNKTGQLLKEYIRLIKSGIEPSEILVINLNKFKNEHFISSAKEAAGELLKDTHRIQTFYGHCYNAINDNWEFLDSKIKTGRSKSKPNLCGLELSQFLFSESMKNGIFKDYLSKRNLFHQLFKRYSLIVQNNLSEQEIVARSKILKESFCDDAKKAIDFYKLKTLEYRSFDYLRQIAIFREIYLNTDYFKNVKYLFVDDADEITYAVFAFLEYLKPNLADYFIGYDRLGSSRCGYLSAYRKSVDKFEEMFNERAVNLQPASGIEFQANTLYKNIKSGKKSNLDCIEIFDTVKRLDMIESAIEKIKNLLGAGVKKEQIAIVTPVVDDMLKFSLKEMFVNIDYQIITGSEKLAENPTVKMVLIILRLIYDKGKFDFENSDFINLLSKFCLIPQKIACQALCSVRNFNDFKQLCFKNDFCDKSFEKLKNLIFTLESNEGGLSEKADIIYSSLDKERLRTDDFRKLAFLSKEIKSFESVFDDKSDPIKIISQLESSVVSENPSVCEEINPHSIVVGTPQKIIDFEIERDYQFWLDISNYEWTKEDIGTLYNSWVFNKDFDRNTFEHQDNINLTKEKTSRVLRKLLLCCNKKSFLYSSMYDSFGIENYGGLTEFFVCRQNIALKNAQIVPRDDQKPVLDYKCGNMGVMAVPGAGKTTVLLALVQKILQSGIKGENIFVLTYMDSAAKNFRERIKNLLPDNFEMPNISTIHGLALRIIKENANYTRLGLNENFEICDEPTRENIIKTLLYQEKIESENFERYSKSISALKLSDKKSEIKSKYKNISDFLKFYRSYNKFLLQNNMIDYDDMLCLSVRLLEENPDILEYYRGLCRYIIEDEAQDSCSLQQYLLKLLSGKYKNLVRCGDINQAITTTFTNTNPKDFRQFLKNSQNVEMNVSQRSSEQIFSLANSLVESANKNDGTKSAFYPIMMFGTKNNPVSKFQPQYQQFKTKREEEKFISDCAKQILSEDPKATIAVLLRNNYQVKHFERFFNSTGLKTISRTDFLDEKPTFKVIFAFLKLKENPFSKGVILEMADVLKEYSLINFDEEDFLYLKNLQSPFIFENFDLLQSENLKQFFSDIEYFVENMTLSADMLSLKIGLYYFSSGVDKSNIYLIAMYIRRLMEKYKRTSILLEELGILSQRPIGAHFRFFTEEEETDGRSLREGKVSIMTVHKSKGDEFDVVFVPEFSLQNYPTTISDTKLKAQTFFTQTLLSLSRNEKQKSDDELKIESVSETMRLIYVAITRAKKRLYFSSNSLSDKGRQHTLISDLLKK